jgi:hypothetical protein
MRGKEVYLNWVAARVREVAFDAGEEWVADHGA